MDGRLECTHFHGSTEESYQGSVVLWSRPGLPIVEGVKGRRDRRNSTMLAKQGWGVWLKYFLNCYRKSRLEEAYLILS